MDRLVPLPPTGGRGIRGLSSLWVGNRLADRGIGEGPEPAEIAAAAFGHRPAELRMVVGEELKGGCRRPLLPHEEKGSLREEEQQHGERPPDRGVNPMMKPVPEGAIDPAVWRGPSDRKSTRRTFS